MEVEVALSYRGGVARRGELVAACGRRAFNQAVREGGVVRLHRDRYAFPGTDAAVTRAHALTGVLCLTSAAMWHGWGVLRAPDTIHVAVARGRRIDAARLDGVTLHRLDPDQDERVERIATSKELTLRHCLGRLPFDEALAVADSACRAGDVATLRRIGLTARGRGTPKVRWAVAAARADAANPFESALRAIALSVPGLHVEPQVLITSVTPWARVDLADKDLRIVLEADSFQWHGHRAALAADAERYNALVADDWRVLRFTWEDVMFRAAAVRQTLVTVVALARRHTKVRHQRRQAA